MLLFFAGSAGVENPECGCKDIPLREEIDQRLLSYHYMGPSLDKYYFNDEVRPHYSNIIMDSGAFSAWNRGAVIDLEAYADYCLKYLDYISYVVNLDVIPSKPGDKKPDDDEIERSASAGYKNYEYLLSRGIPKEKLIHVFHQNENFHWLEKMVADMPYIGLSPANDRTVNEKIQWLKKCMPYVTDSNGYATVKFHGFAVTSFRIMKQFPWYSVDSSTWATVAGRGVTFIPKYKHGSTTEFDFYDKEPYKCSLSQVVNKKDHFDLQYGDKLSTIKHYLDSLNIEMGNYGFKIVPNDYKLKKKERPCSSKYLNNLNIVYEDDVSALGFTEKGLIPNDNLPDENGIYRKPNNIVIPNGHKLIEVVFDVGIRNDWKYRQFLNARFLKRFGLLKPNPAVYTGKDKTNEENIENYTGSKQIPGIL